MLDAGYKKQSGKWMIGYIRFIQISACHDDPQSFNAHLVTEARAMASEKLNEHPNQNIFCQILLLGLLKAKNGLCRHHIEGSRGLLLAHVNG